MCEVSAVGGKVCRCGLCPPCQIDPVTASFKRDLPQTRAEPISSAGGGL